MACAQRGVPSRGGVCWRAAQFCAALRTAVGVLLERAVAVFQMACAATENALSCGGRCRIRTCVGVSRRIYSPSRAFAVYFG